MGKSSDSVLKRYRNNVRVDPSSLAHYMCYHCGKTLSDRLEYQQHMLKVHEVLSQSYQLWSDHTMDTLGLRWSASKHPEDHEMSGSVSPKSRTSKAKDSDDDDEDYVYEEDEKASRKRRRDEDGAKSRGKRGADKQKRDELKRKQEAESRRKKRAEEKRREEKMRKEEERRKAEEVSLAFESNKDKEKTGAATSVKEAVEVEKKPENPEKKRRRRTDGSRRKEEEQGDKPEVAALVKIILEESKKKEASRQETEDEDMYAEPTRGYRKPFEANAYTTKYCKICKKGTHFTFATLFQHYIEHHHAVLKSFHYYGFHGTKLMGKKLLTERDYCQRCIIKFSTTNDYYQHMINNHIFESVRCQPDFETASHADVEAKLEFRDRTLVCGYHFPLSHSDRPQNPATAPEAPKPLVWIKKEVIKEEEPDYDTPSTSTAVPKTTQ